MANGIVWYLGHSLDGATTNPVVAEGYDEADNLIYQIRFGGVEFGMFLSLWSLMLLYHLFFALKSYSYPTIPIKPTANLRGFIVGRVRVLTSPICMVITSIHSLSIRPTIQSM